VPNPPTSDIRSIFARALSTADDILRAATSDQRNISQAMKMADAEVVLGAGEEDKLEKLRWYVYPQECAADLARASFCGNSLDMLGAIHPTCSSKAANPDSVAVEGASAKEEHEQKSVGCDIPKSERILWFRDGEHSGEAPLDEIREGVDEGELSENCQVFDNKAGEWIRIDSFLSLQNDADSPLFDDIIATDQKRLTKKESRDCASWGKGHSILTEENKKGTSGAISAFPSNANASSKKKKKTRHTRPPPKMMRLCTQALMQWDMIEEGDRLLLGLSGGKDSLSLLHCLLEFQRKLPINFEIEVATIDPMTPSFDPSPLIPYVRDTLGLKYHFISDEIVARASTAGKGGKMVTSLCSFCARMKRGNLYACARKNNCNKLVLAQHLDDVGESFMMSVMHNGFLRTMKANYKIDAGDISVIRPLIYCRERLMTDFAKTANLPVINENCPACFEHPKERARVKKMLSREESLYPNFYDNVRRSLLPLMHDDMSSILRHYTEEALAKSRKGGHPKKRKRQTNDEGITADNDVGTNPSSRPMNSRLSDFSDEALIAELARRRACKILKQNNSETNPTEQVCSLNGENGTIPCSMLME